MKVRVYATSGPAWQPVKDGKPYNKWVGTIQFSDVERVMFGRRYAITVESDNKDVVSKKLDKYRIGEILEISDNTIIKPLI